MGGSPRTPENCAFGTQDLRPHPKNTLPKGSFDCLDVQLFIECKTSKTTANKGNFGKKKRGGKKEDTDNGEVVVSIGLMVWDVNDEALKEKRWKRLAV